MWQANTWCPHCGIHNSFNPTRAYVLDPGGFNTGFGGSYIALAAWLPNPDFNDLWWIGVCTACKRPSLFLNGGQEVYPETWIADEDILEPMRGSLIEAKRNLGSASYMSCVVMARRALQEACLDKGAKNGDTLMNQIKELAQNAVITPSVREWAEAIRMVGNDGAHPTFNTITKDDAEDILEITEEILHDLYVTPAKAKRQETKHRTGVPSSTSTP
jgi:Domain of unknown function (DUF4145)